ncbi:hypothetical protein [Kutzneria albida]|nr:hypothetical protein [Kutzneria albida]
MTALVHTATIRPHVHQALTDMISEIAEVNRRVHDLGAHTAPTAG